MIPRKYLVTAAVVGLAAGVSACSASVNTEPDEATVVYSAPKGGATTFSKCVGPSSRDGVSGTDNSWTYPAGQRTFDFTGGKDAESQPLTVVSKDNVQLTVGGFATFALNTSCQTLRQFHERIGLKFNAFFYGTETSATSDDPDEAGWKKMLGVYFKQPLDRALDAASQEFAWKDLFNNPQVKQQWETRVGQLAGQFITEAGGGQFFCAPTFTGRGQCGTVQVTLQKPQPPDSLVDAMAAAEAAKQQNLAQQQVNTKVRTELESMRELVKLLGPDAYVRLRAIQDGRVSVVVLPDGSNINVGKSG
jgi:hypothetical protein